MNYICMTVTSTYYNVASTPYLYCVITLGNRKVPFGRLSLIARMRPHVSGTGDLKVCPSQEAVHNYVQTFIPTSRGQSATSSLCCHLVHLYRQVNTSRCVRSHHAKPCSPLYFQGTRKRQVVQAHEVIKVSCSGPRAHSDQLRPARRLTLAHRAPEPIT
jgi:hypothetical protein